MSDESLEQRVARLEQIVEEMRREIDRLPGQPGRDDWQSTIGAFADDPIADEIIDEALRLREEERRKFHS
jgi:hypothetical protein